MGDVQSPRLTTGGYMKYMSMGGRFFFSVNQFCCYVRSSMFRNLARKKTGHFVHTSSFSFFFHIASLFSKRWPPQPPPHPHPQWIGLRENLQETHGFLPSNIGLSCKFSHHPTPSPSPPCSHPAACPRTLCHRCRPSPGRSP